MVALFRLIALVFMPAADSFFVSNHPTLRQRLGSLEMGRLQPAVEKPLAMMLSKRAKRRLSATQRSQAHACPGTLSANYLVVMDFECTCERGVGSHYEHEIIEWPAVLVSTTDGTVVDEFHEYVQPSENRTLTEFCTELTGIEQGTVDAAQPLITVMNNFNEWLSGHGLHFQPPDELESGASTGGTAESFPSNRNGLPLTMAASNETCAPGLETPSSTAAITSTSPANTFVLCTDGPWDLKYFLAAECARKGGELAAAHAQGSHFMRWCNLRWLHAAYYNKPRMGLKGSLAFHQMTFEGRPHSGIDDTRNIARVASRMLADGCSMPLNDGVADEHAVAWRPFSGGRKKARAAAPKSTVATRARAPAAAASATAPVSLEDGASSDASNASSQSGAAPQELAGGSKGSTRSEKSKLRGAARAARRLSTANSEEEPPSMRKGHIPSAASLESMFRR